MPDQSIALAVTCRDHTDHPEGAGALHNKRFPNLNSLKLFPHSCLMSKASQQEGSTISPSGRDFL